MRAPKTEGVREDLVEGCNNDFSESYKAIEGVLSSDTKPPCCVDLGLLVDSLGYLRDET